MSSKPCNDGVADHCEAGSLQDFAAIEVFCGIVGGGALNEDGIAGDDGQVRDVERPHFIRA